MRRGVLAIAAMVVLAAALSARATAYPWPVKPFAGSHAIRSTFGDPRTWFDGPPTTATLLHGTGSFSFHSGVDIVVPDGTPVYPVQSGVVTLSRAMKVFTIFNHSGWPAPTPQA